MWKGLFILVKVFPQVSRIYAWCDVPLLVPDISKKNKKGIKKNIIKRIVCTICYCFTPLICYILYNIYFPAGNPLKDFLREIPAGD
jgi:hypothetical protein